MKNFEMALTLWMILMVGVYYTLGSTIVRRLGHLLTSQPRVFGEGMRALVLASLSAVAFLFFGVSLVGSILNHVFSLTVGRDLHSVFFLHFFAVPPFLTYLWIRLQNLVRDSDEDAKRFPERASRRLFLSPAERVFLSIGLVLCLGFVIGFPDYFYPGVVRPYLQNLATGQCAIDGVECYVQVAVAHHNPRLCENSDSVEECLDLYAKEIPLYSDCEDLIPASFGNFRMAECLSRFSQAPPPFQFCREAKALDQMKDFVIGLCFRSKSDVDWRSRKTGETGLLYIARHAGELENPIVNYLEQVLLAGPNGKALDKNGRGLWSSLRDVDLATLFYTLPPLDASGVDREGRGALQNLALAHELTPERVHKLIGWGANPNGRDPQGNTALHSLTMDRAPTANERLMRDLAIAELLNRGASFDLKNQAGESARDLARANGYVQNY